MAAIGGATITSEVYAWVVVFLLPLNSAINPLLYTISAIKQRPRGRDRHTMDLSVTMKSRALEDDNSLGTLSYNHIT